MDGDHPGPEWRLLSLPKEVHMRYKTFRVKTITTGVGICLPPFFMLLDFCKEGRDNRVLQNCISFMQYSIMMGISISFPGLPGCISWGYTAGRYTSMALLSICSNTSDHKLADRTQFADKPYNCVSTSAERPLCIDQYRVHVADG